MPVRNFLMHSIGGKALLTVGALGATGAMAAFGTFASFTSSDSASHALSSGAVSIALGGTNRLTIGASGLVPGDTIQRQVDLSNTGSGDALASITLTSSATVSSLLDTDTTDGLQMVIDKCSVPWTEGGTPPAYTYTCGGTTSSVLASRPVIGSNLALSNLSSLTSGNTDHLRVTLTFPSGAGNGLQSKSSTIQYTFTGNQRTATDK